MPDAAAEPVSTPRVRTAPVGPDAPPRRHAAGGRLAVVEPARPAGRGLRIAIIAHHVAPIAPPFAGGVESVTWYLARWLAEQGHAVTVFAPPGSCVPGVTHVDLDLAHRFTPAGRADVSMPPDAFMAAHHAYQSLMVRLAAGHEFDVIHTHALHYLPVALAGLVRGPQLLTLHTPPTPWLESALISAPPALRLLCVSPSTAASWAAVATVDDIVPNGIDTARFRAGPGGEDAVWFGRIVPEKAPHLAIRAARAAGYRIRLAGPVVDRDYHDAHVRPLLDGRDVDYLGHLDHDGLHEVVGRSAVALQTPEWEEPFCLAAVEAMACGTPVAAFARGALPSVVGRRGGALARGGDVVGLGAAIAAAAELPRAAVRRRAVDAFGLDAMGTAHERIYRELCRAEAATGSGPREWLAG